MRIIALVIVALAGTAQAQNAVSNTQELDRIKLETRQRLVPVIDFVLGQSCGDSCTGYRIDPRAAVTSSAEGQSDVGFPAAETGTGVARLTSVSVTVLVKDKVANAARERLRQTLAYRLQNEVSAPLTVQLQNATGTPLATEKTESPVKNASAQALPYVRALSWPLALILMGLVALVGAFSYFRFRRGLLREKKLLREAATSASQTISELQDTAKMKALREERIEGLLAKQGADLAWLLDTKARNGDGAFFSQIAKLVPAEKALARIEVGGSALRALAESVSPGDKALNPTEWEDAFQKLEREIERASYLRALEARDPLSAYANFSESELVGLFRDLGDTALQALFLARLPQNRWSALMSALTADNRVTLGTYLAHLGETPAQDRNARYRDLADRLAALRRNHGGPVGEISANTLEDYILYLDQNEGQKLGQSLAKSNLQTSLPDSLNAIVTNASNIDLVEMALQMDLASLRVVLNELSPESQKRFKAAMPSGLKERLSQASMPVSERDRQVLARNARATLLRAQRGRREQSGSANL